MGFEFAGGGRRPKRIERGDEKLNVTRCIIQMKKYLNYTEKETLSLTVKKYVMLMKELAELNKPAEELGTIDDLP